MTDLSPLQAARIANGVYRLREHGMAELADLHQELGSENEFNVGANASASVSGQRFTGRSGGLLVWKQVTGFGYLATGKGARQGEVLVATRGTAIGVDWLSNFNVGVQRGPAGHLVHAGFNEVWKSFAEAIASFMRGRNASVIHCVGHSLGGALATLNADYMSNAGMGQVRLYTFGSPRVGCDRFARSLGRRVGQGNIHRVFHRSDVVPMTPLFPFIHVPIAWPACEISNGDRGPISKQAHSMTESYIPGVGGASWGELERGSAQARDAEVRSWLDRVADGGGLILPFGASALQMIGRALSWILRQVRDALVADFGLTLAAGMTILDQFAWLLSKGTTLALDMGRYIGAMIGAIMRFLGRTAAAGTQLTFLFVRWVLGMLYQTLAATARGAVRLVTG